MNKEYLKKLLERYQQAEQSGSVEDILFCSEKLQLTLEKIAPVKEQLDDESKGLVIELQDTHLRVVELMKCKREQLRTVLEESGQYKERAKAYVQTQLTGQYIL